MAKAAAAGGSSGRRADRAGGRSDLGQKMRSREWRCSVATVAVVVAGYFASSLTLTFFQKSLISHLRFPITIVTCHLVIKFLLSGLCRQAWAAFSSSSGGQPRVVLAWPDYLSRVAVVAVISALDIGLSQWSFEFITVSLYTMTKTTAVLFILMFALIFKLEKKHWSLIVIVLMISLGLFLFVFKSTSFHAAGFAMALSAAFLSGARWTLSQLIMQKSKLGLQNPIDLIYHIQPLMVLTLLPFAAGFEGLHISASEHLFRYHEYGVVLTTSGLILLGGSIAFVMEVFEFYIVTKASSLTLSIVGIVKEIVTIFLDVFINGSELTTVNILGVAICLTGISIHIFRKATTHDPSSSSSPAPYRRADIAYNELSLPLLSDEDESDLSSSDDDEVFNVNFGQSGKNSGSKKPYRDAGDDFFLKDRREWTGVRDSHLKMSREEKGKGSSGADSPPSVLLVGGRADGRSKKRRKQELLADIELDSD